MFYTLYCTTKRRHWFFHTFKTWGSEQIEEFIKSDDYEILGNIVLVDNPTYAYDVLNIVNTLQEDHLCFCLRFSSSSNNMLQLSSNIVIDMAIYGNVNYSPFSMWNNKLDTPYIGSYEDSVVQYGKFKFDDDWSDSMIAQTEGWSFEQYMNGLPQNRMWKIVCELFLNRTPTNNLIEHLKTHIKNKYIERS